jgi:hypothetical protein
MLISGLLNMAVNLLAALSPLQLLSQLLQRWGAHGAAGLQGLLDRLQVVGSGVLLAPAQLQQYRDVVQGVGWATMQWSGEWGASLPAVLH